MHLAAPTGWSSWYYYYNKIGLEDLHRNLARIREARLPLSVFQIDDGYQSRVGDWLSPAAGFEDMEALAGEISKAGCTPGLWLAPFIADRSSRLVREHPGYLLRNEHGRAIPAGYNLRWPGKIYYALDITNPRVEEYLRKIIHTVTAEWGFRYLKLDFLYAACLRGGAHTAMNLSRAQVMKRAVEILRDEAGSEVALSGCGMPLSSGIGVFDAMRIGADTAPHWHKLIGHLLRSGAIEGVKNSIRNSFVRAPMNNRLWRNDPDCVMLRTRGSRLNRDERRTQINAAILSGGSLFFSDDFSRLRAEEISEAERILALHRECAEGETICLDLMEREFPELVLNTAGFLGVFNMSCRRRKQSVDLSRLTPFGREPRAFEDVWSGSLIDPKSPIPPHGSLLLRMVY